MMMLSDDTLWSCPTSPGLGTGSVSAEKKEGKNRFESLQSVGFSVQLQITNRVRVPQNRPITAVSPAESRFFFIELFSFLKAAGNFIQILAADGKTLIMG